MIRVVKVIIKEDQKYLLLKRRSSSTFFPDQWDFAGGKIEPNEKELTAVAREVNEETTLEVIPNKQIGEFDYTEHNKDINFQIFDIKSFSGEVSLSKDHSDYIWATKEDLKNIDLTPIVKLFFESYD